MTNRTLTVVIALAVVLGSTVGVAAAAGGTTTTELTTGDSGAVADAGSTYQTQSTVFTTNAPDNETTENGTTDNQTVDGNGTTTDNQTVDGNETTTDNQTVDGNETTTDNQTVDGNETTTDNQTVDGNETVSVSVGSQLSTVLSLTSEEVQGEVANTTLAASFARANETERAALLAQRASELQNSSDAIAADYEALQTAYTAGNLSKGEVAQRLGLLNARASQVSNSLERVQRLSNRVSGLELRAAGYDTAAVNETLGELERFTGSGTGTLLRQFTTGASRNVSISTDGGLSVSVSDGNGSSREIERSSDDNVSLSISQTTALSAARGALSGTNGSWVLTSGSIDTEDGTYSFEFDLQNAGVEGSGEVTVDGSSGTVVELEEKIGDVVPRGPPEGQPRGPPEDVPGNGNENGNDDRSESNDSDGENGDDSDDENGDNGRPDDTPAGNETAGDRGNGNQTAGDRGNDEREGNDTDEVELSLLVIDGTPQPNETVTLRVLAGGVPAEGVPVRLNGATVGTTDANGTVSVTLPARGEAELTAVRNDSEASVEFEFGEDDADEEIARQLDASGTVDNGTVTITVTYDGEGVAGARALVDGERVGTTGPDGSLSFDSSANETLVVEIVKGQFQTTLTFAVSGDTLELNQTTVGGDEKPESENGDKGNGDGEGDDKGNGDGEGDDKGNGDGEGDDKGNGDGEGSDTSDNGGDSDTSDSDGSDGSDTSDSDGSDTSDTSDTSDSGDDSESGNDEGEGGGSGQSGGEGGR